MHKKRPVLLSGLLVGLALTIAGMHKPAYSGIFQPDDPVSRAIRKAPTGWGEPVELMPKPFKSGMTKAEVEKILTEGKFKPDESRVFSRRHPLDFPPDSLFYSKLVTGMPCALDYVVVVQYDEQHTLSRAVGTYDEAGCL